MSFFTGRPMDQLKDAQDMAEHLLCLLERPYESWLDAVKSELLSDECSCAWDELIAALRAEKQRAKEAEADSPEARAERRAEGLEQRILRNGQIGR